ncbi:MAG: NAD-dependent epimerase/dehydratase family protein [Candidatus Omnitrophica bacterium]|nr:NAD-dependent epimerase/dehydratase family protein [Candidatus Omnitrophota bacterium]
MKILVTGANGFIGRACVAALVARGHEVDALDLADTGCFSTIGINSFHACDITAPFTIAGVFDVVVHLAAYNITHVGDTDPAIYDRVNVNGTANVLAGIDTRRFVFLSTSKVYGRDQAVITEESLIAPSQPYEKSKLKAEGLLLNARKDGGLVILRSVNVFGPGQPEKAVIPIFCAQAMQNAPVKVVAPRGSWLQFVYIDDLVRALVLAASAVELAGIYNVSTDETLRLDALALMVRKVCGSGSEVIFTDERSVSLSRVSFDKLKNKTGWEPAVAIEEGVRRYHEYYVQKPSA